jgi:hypothetical protein
MQLGCNGQENLWRQREGLKNSLQRPWKNPLVMTNIAMENESFIVDDVDLPSGKLT